MILVPAPLQRPALAGTGVRPLLRSGTLTQFRSATPARPVLQSAARAPQQLCLDLQPRLR
jgi:hypothetical protein